MDPDAPGPWPDSQSHTLTEAPPREQQGWGEGYSRTLLPPGDGGTGNTPKGKGPCPAPKAGARNRQMGRSRGTTQIWLCSLQTD